MIVVVSQQKWERRLLFIQLFCPTWISAMGNLGSFPWEKPAVTESHYPTCYACWVSECFHNPPNSDMDYRFFNMRTDVIACDSTWSCMDTTREPALKVDCEGKILCRTRESNLSQWCAGLTLSTNWATSVLLWDLCWICLPHILSVFIRSICRSLNQPMRWRSRHQVGLIAMCMHCVTHVMWTSYTGV